MDSVVPYFIKGSGSLPVRNVFLSDFSFQVRVQRIIWQLQVNHCIGITDTFCWCRRPRQLLHQTYSAGTADCSAVLLEFSD